MAETHVLSALAKKRAEVSGEIKHYEKLLKQSKINLQSYCKTSYFFKSSLLLRRMVVKLTS